MRVRSRPFCHALVPPSENDWVSPVSLPAGDPASLKLAPSKFGRRACFGYGPIASADGSGTRKQGGEARSRLQRGGAAGGRRGGGRREAFPFLPPTFASPSLFHPPVLFLSLSFLGLLSSFPGKTSSLVQPLASRTPRLDPSRLDYRIAASPSPRQQATSPPPPSAMATYRQQPSFDGSTHELGGSYQQAPYGGGGAGYEKTYPEPSRIRGGDGGESVTLCFLSLRRLARRAQARRPKVDRLDRERFALPT